MAEALAAEHLDVSALFREAGLDFDALSDPDARFPSDDISLLWELAVARSGNPTVGLAGARIPKAGYFGVVTFAMMSAPNLLGVLDRTVRYIAIVSDAATAMVQNYGPDHRLTLSLVEDRRPIPYQRYGFDLLMFLSFCRWVTGREIRPLALELGHPATCDPGPYEEAFGCTPRFGAAVNALVFSSEDVLSPLPTAHRLLSAVHDQIAAEHLARLSETRISERVRAAIARHLQDGEPARAAISGELAMSERTLHRRLAAECTSFQRLLEETRRQLAEEHLNRRDLSLADITYLLGFKDQSSFFRSAKRWFGMTPRQYRLHPKKPAG